MSSGPERGFDASQSSVSLLRPEDPSHDLHRSPSPMSMLSSTSTIIPPATLAGTDPAVFQATLEYFYTGSSTAQAFTVLLDGFGEDVREGEAQAGGVDKLRQVSCVEVLGQWLDPGQLIDTLFDRICCFHGGLTCTPTA